jgi:PAS domain S-box-containing protein
VQTTPPWPSTAADRAAVLDALLQATDQGVYALDGSGVCLFINSAGAEALGYQPAELIGQVAHDLFHHSRPDGTPYPVAECRGLEAMRLGHDVWREDEVFWRHDGAPLPVEYTVVPLRAAGESVYAVVTFRDISRRRLAEAEQQRLTEELRLAEARYRTLFEGAADALLVADAQAQYQDANRAAELLLGYSRDELRRMSVADVVAAGPTWTEAEYMRYSASGRWQGELEVRRKDGQLVPVEANASVILVPGADALYISALRDISDRRRAEAALREAQREREIFLASISHDLRSPLTTLRLQAQLIERQARRPGGPDADRLVQAAATADQTVRRMAAMLDELIDLAHLQEGRALQLRRERLDLVELVREAVAQQQPISPQHPLRLACAEASIVGEWDAARLQRVLANLLGNATKYSSSGQEVRVEVRREPEQALISVADRGVGIPAAEVPRIFDRYFRASNVRDQQEGSGLGLSSARYIVEQHGGTLAVDSVEGQGTTFTIALPLTPTDAPPDAPGAP